VGATKRARHEIDAADRARFLAPGKTTSSGALIGRRIRHALRFTASIFFKTVTELDAAEGPMNTAEIGPEISDDRGRG